MMEPEVEIVEPVSEPDLDAMRALLWSYIRDMRVIYSGTSMVEELDDDVWTRELESLPRKYGSPQGGMLLARSAAGACGCVCLRALDAGIGEMKRLYVIPSRRGQRIAERLVRGVAALALERGLSRIVFDVGWRQTAALAAYRRMGCVEIPPYHSGSDWFLAHSTFFAADPHLLAGRGGSRSREESTS
jgi:GNAT superfamily N-acetyltransferase